MDDHEFWMDETKYEAAKGGLYNRIQFLGAIDSEKASLEILKEKGLKESPQPNVNDKQKISYPHDAIVAAKAIAIANYQCEIDRNHPSFIRRTNNKNYTESHHLIPISAQADFEYSLDIEENIVSLCSNCHNCLNYGADEIRENSLYQLYNQRKALLEQVGLSIKFDNLKKHYQFQEE